MKRGGLIVLVLSGAALASVLASAPAAHARPGGKAGVLEYRKNSRLISKLAPAHALAHLPSVTVPAARWAQLKVGCGKGRETVGGGTRALGSVADTYLLQSTGTSRWTSWAWRPASAPVKKLFAHAICRKISSRRAEEVAVRLGLPQGGSFVSIACPGNGWHVTGGGIFANAAGTGKGFVQSLYPIDGADSDQKPDDGWGAWLHHSYPPFPNTTYTAEVVALCQRRAPKYRQRTVQISGSDVSKTTVKCRKREHVTGGGASITGGTLDAHVSSTYPIDGGDRGKVPDDGWRVLAESDSAASKTLTAYAICGGSKGKP